MSKNNWFVLNTIVIEGFLAMKVKNLLLLTAFLTSFGLSCSQSALAGAECGDREGGWQLGCNIYNSGKIEIYNKSTVGVWLDIAKGVSRGISATEIGFSSSTTKYFSKRILLAPGKSELVEFENIDKTHLLQIYNCATEQDADAPIRCPNYVDIKSL